MLNPRPLNDSRMKTSGSILSRLLALPTAPRLFAATLGLALAQRWDDLTAVRFAAAAAALEAFSD